MRSKISYEGAREYLSSAGKDSDHEQGDHTGEGYKRDKDRI